MHTTVGSGHLARYAVTLAALVGFGLLAATVLEQRRALDRLEDRVAVLEQAPASCAAEQASDDDDDDQGSALAIQLDDDDDDDHADVDDSDDDDQATAQLGDDQDMEQLLVAASSLYTQGTNSDWVIRLAEPATRVPATAPRAWALIAAAACAGRDVVTASRAYNKLDAKGRAFARPPCRLHDIYFNELHP